MSFGPGVEKRIVEAMKQLGFTSTDAKAYVALLKNNPATGYELAARSGVPRSAIYNVLRRLEGLGLVNAVQAKPAKYLPLPPEQLLALIETQFSRSLDELKTTLESLSQSPAEAVTWTISGYQTTLAQAQGLISAAESSVHMSLWRREAKQLVEPLQEAAARGVEVVLFSFNPLPEVDAQVFSYGIAEEELGRYWAHKLILITDHNRALVGGAEETEENRAVVTQEKSLVEMAISNLVLDITLYGQRMGADTSEVITGLTVHLAPVEDLLKKAAS